MLQVAGAPYAEAVRGPRSKIFSARPRARVLGQLASLVPLLGGPAVSRVAKGPQS